MIALRPVEIRDILPLWIVTIIRHEAVLHAEVGETTNGKTRPSIFEGARSVRAGNTQHIQPNLFIKEALFGICSLFGVSDIRINDEVGADGVNPCDCHAVGFAGASSCISTLRCGSNSIQRAESAWIKLFIRQETKTTIGGEFFVDVVIDLGIKRFFVIGIRSRGVIIVRETGTIG